MTKIISNKFFITFMKIEIEEAELTALVAVAEAAQRLIANMARNAWIGMPRRDTEKALAALAAIRGQQCTAPLNLLTALESREAMMTAIAKEDE